jgi:hypothetical protein
MIRIFIPKATNILEEWMREIRNMGERRKVGLPKAQIIMKICRGEIRRRRKANIHKGREEMRPGRGNRAANTDRAGIANTGRIAGRGILRRGREGNRDKKAHIPAAGSRASMGRIGRREIMRRGREGNRDKKAHIPAAGSRASMGRIGRREIMRRGRKAIGAIANTDREGRKASIILRGKSIKAGTQEGRIILPKCMDNDEKGDGKNVFKLQTP